MISSIANLVYEFHHNLPDDLRLRNEGNIRIIEMKEILGKSQIWVEI